MINKKSIIALSIIMTISGCASNISSSYDKEIKTALEDIPNWEQKKVNTEKPVSITGLIDIEELRLMIDEAMENNPGLQQSIIALDIAKKQNEAAWSAMYPDVDFSFSGDKEEGSSREFTSDISISWEADIWNKSGDGISGAIETIKYTESELEYVKSVLAADIMRQWLLISANQQYLEIEKKKLKALLNNEVFMRERYIRGLGDLQDIDTAKTSIAASKANVENYSETINQNKRQLGLLIGKLGIKDEIKIPSEFPNVLTPIVSIPEQDLANRPDLKQAFSQLKINQYSESVSYKDMLPSISLSASLSDSSSSPIESLFKDPLWSLLGNITAPLFRGGELKSAAEISTLEVQQSYWEYQETLLNAVVEVEDSLGQEESLRKQQDFLSDAYKSAKRSESSYQNKYESGLIEILDLISVQQTTYDAEINLVEAKYNRLINRIDLGLALGLKA